MTHIEGVTSFIAPDPNSPAINLEPNAEGQNVPLIAGLDIDFTDDIATALEDYTLTTDLDDALALKLDATVIDDYTDTADLTTALDLKLDIADENVSAFVAAIADTATATLPEVGDKVNALLAALVAAGLMAAS